jgi:hypothetical protein
MLNLLFRRKYRCLKCHESLELDIPVVDILFLNFYMKSDSTFTIISRQLKLDK